MIASSGPPMVASRPGETDDRVVLLDVAADQFVRLGDADDFLHARHFFQRAGFDLARLPVMPMAVRSAPGMEWAR